MHKLWPAILVRLVCASINGEAYTAGDLGLDSEAESQVCDWASIAMVSLVCLFYASWTYLMYWNNDQDEADRKAGRSPRPESWLARAAKCVFAVGMIPVLLCLFVESVLPPGALEGAKGLAVGEQKQAEAA